MINSALNKWRNGDPSLGIWLNLPDMHLVETLARSGADWLCFDLQHGLMDYALSGQTATPLVRVAANTPDQIGKVLDVGAEGVIVPMVNTVAEARRAVAACYYPPLGQRSCGPMRPAMLHGFEYLSQANDQIACVPMIETEEGLDNVDAIASVDGGNSRFTDAVATIVEACRKHSRAVGMFGYTPEMARESLDSGINFASAGTDISFFRSGLTRALALARGEDPDEAGRQAGY